MTPEPLGLSEQPVTRLCQPASKDGGATWGPCPACSGSGLDGDFPCPICFAEGQVSRAPSWLLSAAPTAIARELAVSG